MRELSSQVPNMKNIELDFPPTNTDWNCPWRKENNYKIGCSTPILPNQFKRIQLLIILNITKRAKMDAPPSSQVLQRLFTSMFTSSKLFSNST